MKNHRRPPSSLRPSRAFSLVEMLVVIAIIGVVAGLTLPVMSKVKRWQYLNTARAELNQIQTALENYKAQYGAYPSYGGNPQSPPLYTELSGNGVINATNSATSANTDDTTSAKNFLYGLRSKEVAGNQLVTSVGGPDQSYLNALLSQGLGGNPIRYLCPGTYNPTSYDLWVQLSINGQLNLVCNWSRQVQINNNSLP